MVNTIEVAALPLAPGNPLPYLQQVKAVRAYHTGLETLRDAGGPVTRCSLAPAWIMPPVVIVTSPRGAREVMGRPGAFLDKTLPMHKELRRAMGSNLFDLAHDAWLPRRRALQPVFTKQHVAAFAGHMAEAAERVPRGWRDGAEIDLDSECRTLTLRVLGRSVLGLDLDERADALATPLRTVVRYAMDRAFRPVRAPRWLPTPARHRARLASSALRKLAAEIVQACRADPTRDAPLVHALIAATDPATGQPLTDSQICDELLIFLLAGHDTTATALSYSLWALGRHLDLQDRVAAEVAALGDRALTPEDLPRLKYTAQVLQEGLRLCPPAAAAARMAMQDIDIDGHRVEAGTMVMVGIHALHRDPELWDDPLAFDPDRFSPQNVKGRDRWQYLPFGGGPRSCIGDHFAMLEATLGLGSMIRLAEIRSLDEDFRVEVPFTTVAAGPIRARVRLRNRPTQDDMPLRIG
jgi:cytochrome P450